MEYFLRHLDLSNVSIWWRMSLNAFEKLGRWREDTFLKLMKLQDLRRGISWQHWEASSYERQSLLEMFPTPKLPSSPNSHSVTVFISFCKMTAVCTLIFLAATIDFYTYKRLPFLCHFAQCATRTRFRLFLWQNLFSPPPSSSFLCM